MSYEMFRTTIATRLQDYLPVKLLHDVLQQIDDVASQYEIKRTTTDLITISDEPEMVKMYLASLAIANKAMSTLGDYRMHLKRFFTHVKKPFNTVTANDIRLYMHEYQMESNLAKSSLDHVRTVIYGFYSWCVNQEIMERNPCKLVDKVKVPKKQLPPLEQIDLEYLRAGCQTPREKALVDFLVSSGCRIAECAALKLSDINFADRSVLIRHGKGDKQRVTCFNAESEVSLRVYLSSKKHESEYLFSRSRAPYGEISSTALRREICKIRKRVMQVPVKTTPHTLRRTMATLASDNGMPIQDIQLLLGHSSLDTTMRYVSRSDQKIQTSYRRYIV